MFRHPGCIARRVGWPAGSCRGCRGSWSTTALTRGVSSASCPSFPAESFREQFEAARMNESKMRILQTIRGAKLPPAANCPSLAQRLDALRRPAGAVPVAGRIGRRPRSCELTSAGEIAAALPGGCRALPTANADHLRASRALTGNVDLDAVDDPHDLEAVDFAVLPGQFGVAENGAVWVTDEQREAAGRSTSSCSTLALVVAGRSDRAQHARGLRPARASAHRAWGCSSPAPPKRPTSSNRWSSARTARAR